MPGKFCIYSKDIDPTTAPYNADPSPTTLIRLDRDPIVEGSYEIESVARRGSVRHTLGGIQIQDFGKKTSDDILRLSDSNALSETTKIQLDSAIGASGESWYFTDGYDIYEIAFVRGSIRLMRNLALAHFGRQVFSYDMELQIIDKL